MIGISLWGAGEFADAVPHLERAVTLYAPEAATRPIFAIRKITRYGHSLCSG